MRQAGIIAAGALYALHNNRSRIGEDHEKARAFALGVLEGTSNVTIDLDAVQTNIVLIVPTNVKDLPKALSKLKGEGVLLSMGKRDALRAVTHLDVSLEECKKAALVVANFFNA
jgi:threonine aldolase